MDFEWDPEKAASNEKKHGISFDLSTLVFKDPHVVEWPDLTVDYGEERWIAVGIASNWLLNVVYTVRGSTTRIISARKAAPDEQRRYRNG